MTIHLPEDLESTVRAEVLSGRFASEDELVTEAVRAYLRQRRREATGHSSSDPILGLMRDDAELMDEIVADAYRQRREPLTDWSEQKL